MQLDVTDLTVRYGALTVLDGVSFTVRAHDFWMLCGPNGAGKSTVVSALLQAAPYKGDILLDGQRLSAMRPRARAHRIGFLQQTHAVGFAYAVEEVVRLGRYAYPSGGRGAADDAAVEAALRRTGMLEKRRQNVLTLSGGELQRTFLAQLLAQDPPLIVLDEPANHLDPQYQRAVFTLLDEWRRQPGRAVVAVVHDVSLARRFGTRALLLKNGKTLACGDPAEALSTANLSAAYDMDLSGWMRELSAPWNERNET